MAIIQMEIKDCSFCPKHFTQSTPMAGYAYDYYCKITNEKVAGYIEWPNEMPEVPKNCPLRVD